MSLEIANKLHAVCTFNAIDPPAILRGDGINSVTRSGAGSYTLRLNTEPGGLLSAGGGSITGLDWFITWNVLVNGPASAIVAVQASIDPTDARNILVLCYNAAGALADGAQVQIAVWRLPTV